MRPTLKQLQYLVAIAETGKINEAARRMNVSQPSLSAQLVEMELELGKRLVERGRLGAILTPSGEEVVRRARIVLQGMEGLKAAIGREQGILSGRIKLGVIPSVGPYLLPHVTGRLHAMFPLLRLGVQEYRTFELDTHLREGRLDTIISTAEDHPNTRSFTLFRESLWICVAPESPLSVSRAPIKLDELKDLPLLSLGYGHHLNLAIREMARLSGGYISSEYEGTSLDAVRQMAAMGAGVAILPSLYALMEASRDRELVLRRIAHKDAQRTISLVWRDTSPMGEDIEQLASVLKDVANSLLGKEA